MDTKILGSFHRENDHAGRVIQKKKAGDCVQCGHCDSRCPFHVEQSKRMQEIKAYFGC